MEQRRVGCDAAGRRCPRRATRGAGQRGRREAGGPDHRQRSADGRRAAALECRRIPRSPAVPAREELVDPFPEARRGDLVTDAGPRHGRRHRARHRLRPRLPDWPFFTASSCRRSTTQGLDRMDPSRRRRGHRVRDPRGWRSSPARPPRRGRSSWRRSGGRPRRVPGWLGADGPPWQHRRVGDGAPGRGDAPAGLLVFFLVRCRLPGTAPGGGAASVSRCWPRSRRSRRSRVLLFGLANVTAGRTPASSSATGRSWTGRSSRARPRRPRR